MAKVTDDIRKDPLKLLSKKNRVPPSKLKEAPRKSEKAYLLRRDADAAIARADRLSSPGVNPFISVLTMTLVESFYWDLKKRVFLKPKQWEELELDHWFTLPPKTTKWQAHIVRDYIMGDIDKKNLQREIFVKRCVDPKNHKKMLYAVVRLA